MSATARKAIFPGSFDPVTRGHLDLIERSAVLFDAITVAVIDNPNKNSLFSVAERVEMLREATGAIHNVKIDFFSGLLVEFLQARAASVVIRGLRHGLDLEGEFQMARLNQEMLPTMDTVFLAARPAHIHISSSFVREIARLGGDFSFLVPACVHPKILQKYRGKV